MLKDKILLNTYKKINRILGGRGLTKYSFVKSVKKYALDNLRADVAYVQGNKMYLDAKDSLQLSINEIYEPIETNKIKQEISNGDVVLDVGANIGYYTLLFAQLVGKHGKVCAFEPEPYNFELLQKNVVLNNYDNVKLEQIAVSNFNGKANLYLSKESTGMHRLNKSVHCDKSIEVDIMKLDDYLLKNEIRQINFVKIDVEGAELDVLQGMEDTIKQNQKMKILLEYIPENILEHGSDPRKLLDFFIRHNFRLYKVDEKKDFAEVSNLDDIVVSYDGKSLFCVKG